MNVCVYIFEVGPHSCNCIAPIDKEIAFDTETAFGYCANEPIDDGDWLFGIDTIIKFHIKELCAALGFFTSTTRMPRTTVALCTENLLEEWVPSHLVIDLEMPDTELDIVSSFLGSRILSEIDLLPSEKRELSVLLDQKMFCTRLLNLGNEADQKLI